MKNHPELNELHGSLACIMCAIIKSDLRTSPQEVKKFNEFFAREFELEKEHIDTLHEDAMQDNSDVDEHLALLKEAFAENIILKGRFMEYLNNCVISDGIDYREYPVFEKVRIQLF